MDWKIILKIIGDCIGFIWNSILYIIGSIFTVATFVWVVRMWRGWTKYKKEVKINHSKDLVKDFQNPYVFLNREKKNLILEVKPYPDEFNEHLGDTAYKDEKKLIKRRDFYISKLHNEELNVFCNELQDNVIYHIKQKNYIEYDFSRPSIEQKNYFNKETIELDILQIVINNHQTPVPILFTIQHHHNLYYLYCGGSIWVAGDDERELKEIEVALIKELNGAFKRKTFELILWYYSEIKEYQTHINEELKQLIGKVGVGVPLKGKCKKCPKEDTLLEYTWQRIDKYLQ